MRVIYGVQPVVEAIRAEQKIDRILISRTAGGQTARIRTLAQEQSISVIEVKKNELSKRAKTSNHQGVVALLDTNEISTVDVEDLLETAHNKNEDPLILLLDSIQDPQNLGAIIRSAHALGAHGVVIPKDRSAQVTPAVVRASAGAALHLRVARVTNLKHAITTLKKANIWTVAAAMDAKPAHRSRLEGPLALVIGGEAKGVRPTVRSACDDAISIPSVTNFDSLNASVAAGILLYEALRQRIDPQKSGKAPKPQQPENGSQ